MPTGPNTENVTICRKCVHHGHRKDYYPEQCGSPSDGHTRYVEFQGDACTAKANAHPPAIEFVTGKIYHFKLPFCRDVNKTGECPHYTVETSYTI